MVVPVPILHVNTCMALTAGKSTTTITNSLPGVNSTQLHAFAEVCSSVSESLSTHNQVVMNSLVSPTKVITTDLSVPASHTHSVAPSVFSTSNLKITEQETLEQNDIPFQNNEADTLIVQKEGLLKNLSDEAMDDEIFNPLKDIQQTLENEDIQMHEASQLSRITSLDILLLCDLFYLPFEHGEKALHLLNEFQWIKSNAQVLLSNETGCNHEESVQEWKRRACAFQTLCQKICELKKKIAFCENREICYDLYTYIWEVSSITSLLNTFVQWLSLGKFPLNIQTFIQGNYTYFSKGWDEAFTSGNNEPWV